MTRKVASNTRSIIVFRRVFLLLFLRDPWAGNRHRRIPAVPHIKLKFIEHAQQNARLLVRDYYWPHPYVSVCDVAQTPNFRLSKTNNKTKNLGNVKFYRGRSPLLMIGSWQGWLFEIWIKKKWRTYIACTFLRGYHYGGLYETLYTPRYLFIWVKTLMMCTTIFPSAPRLTFSKRL